MSGGERLVSAEQNILIVEDHPSIRCLIKASLHDLPCQVIAASHWQAATVRLTEYPISLILLDLGLPDAPDPDKLMIDAVVQAGSIPIIVISAQMDSAVLRWQASGHIAASLPKPFDVGELKQLVSHILGLEEISVSS